MGQGGRRGRSDIRRVSFVDQTKPTPLRMRPIYSHHTRKSIAFLVQRVKTTRAVRGSYRSRLLAAGVRFNPAGAGSPGEGCRAEKDTGMVTKVVTVRVTFCLWD